MNDVQVNYFLSVAQNLSFTKTAEEFFVSQPAVSRQIAALEIELNTSLFKRVNNKIQLTEAGILYYDYFKQSKQKLAEIYEKTYMGKKGKKRIFRIGWVECWNSSLFYPELSCRIGKCFPNIAIRIECYGFKELEYLLEKGQLDIIITYDFGVERREGIEYREIFEIPKAIFYSKFHPLSDRKRPEIGMFSDDLFIVISDQDVIKVNDLTIAAFKAYEIMPRFEKVKNIETMIAMAHNGIGVALLNTWSKLIGHSDFRYITLDNSHDKIITAWRQGSKDSLISFIVEQMLDILN
jgi:DNA-binding transcriptional LysR family regulator